VKIPLAIEDAPPSPRASQAIPILWARSQIADRVRAMTRPYAMRGKNDAGNPTLVEQVTRLGLDYGITTRWTAFVAVSEHQVEGDRPVVCKQVPRQSTFGSAPEPAAGAAMLLLVAMAFAYLRADKRRTL